MTFWLIKNDLKKSTGYALIMFVALLIISSIAISISKLSVSYSMYLYDISTQLEDIIYAFTIIVSLIMGLFIYVLITFGVYINIYQNIKKDYKMASFIFLRTKNMATYLIYKFVFSFLLVLVILTFIYFFDVLCIAGLFGPSEVEGFLSVYFTLVLVYIIYFFKIMLIGLIILNIILLVKYSTSVSVIIYTLIGVTYYIIQIFFWNTNSYLLLGIRALIAGLILILFAGILIDSNMELKQK